MSISAAETPRDANKLLRHLSSQEYKRLTPDLTIVEWRPMQVLYEQDSHIEFVYFPIAGVVSSIVQLPDGRGVEAATIGNEGMIGVPILLGDDVSRTQWMVQIADSAIRIPVSVLRKLMQRNTPFRNRLLHFVNALLGQITQTAACNRVHTAKQRFCRWLLMTHDRVANDDIPLTQKSLAQMLSVRRAGINSIARDLQQKGLIRSRYGSIRIVNRRALASESCECYEIVCREFDRLMGEKK